MKTQLQMVILVAALAALIGCASTGATGKGELGSWDGPQSKQPATVETWTFQNRPARKVVTPHYAIHTTVADDDLVMGMAQVMEGALTQYRKLAPEVVPSGGPMECYVFANRNEWADFTRQIAGADARVYMQITRGAYALNDRFVAFFLGDHGTYAVAAHEGWHQFVARNFKGRIPPFLEEGISCMFENIRWRGDLPEFNLSINADRTQDLRHSLESKELWPLKELCTMHAGQVVHLPPERIEAFYAENWAFARFLWEGDNAAHRQAFQELLSDTARGRVRDGRGGYRPISNGWHAELARPTLEAYVGMDIDAMDVAFQAFMKKVAYEEFKEQWQL